MEVGRGVWGWEGGGVCQRTHLGSLLGVIIEGITNLPVLGSGYGLLHKLIIDAFMHKGAGAGSTALPLQRVIKVCHELAYRILTLMSR